MPSDMSGKREVTFITPGGDMMIRMMSATSNTICEAATQLKATHFVTQDGHDKGRDLPIWGVFSMRGVEKQLGEWVLNEPVRTFVTETSDPAVMFAIHLGRA
jgi:hypothetical protein